MKTEDQARLWKKFRLEWNFNSNHIEGNTLTYPQTELLLIFGKTTGDHDMREYEEMKAHDVAIELIKNYANDQSRELTEADVRELNKIILVRPFWGNAQTLDGQPTRKLIQPGEYKREPNSVLLQNDEMFHYASPEETPAKMNELMSKYRDIVAGSSLHPVEIAARFHYDFVRIHPFDDSNGRTSRLLMNYVLLRKGYPPVVIKSTDKRAYLNALNRADTGEIVAFVEYIAIELTWSLNISIKAAKGESIEEVDDIEKEISVWAKSKETRGSRKVKTLEAIRAVFNSGIKALLLENSNQIQKNFGKLFERSHIDISYSPFGGQTKLRKITPSQLAEFVDEIIERNYSSFPPGVDQFTFERNDGSLIITNALEGFPVENGSFNIGNQIRIIFGLDSYTINYGEDLNIVKSYDAFLSDNELKSIVSESLKSTFNRIKKEEMRS
ncbi:MAG: Fic family protein [Cyclobacteriaceae bacterium]|nr:Fic family protein [Cyclobacteriaceae bacterium]